MAVKGYYNKRRKSHKIGGKEDIISSLPDPILVDILSLIPLNFAVATGNVSRRWQHLWTEITALYIDIRNSKGPFKYWTSFHKRILPQLTSPLIRRFCLNLDCAALSKYGADHIELWFRLISDRWKIEEIKVTSNGYEGHISFPVIFQMPSLVVLELDGDLASNMPPNEVNVANLKKLSIQIDFTQITQYKFMEKLIKYCPSLEDLSLKCCKIRKGGFLVAGDISLSGPNLKRLSVWYSGQYPTKIIEIDAPNLEYLKLYSSVDLFHSVNTPIMLMEADISGNPGKGLMTSKLFDAISNVRSLSLWRAMVGEKPTMFANLTRLMCTMPCSEKDYNALLGLLERCPVLEALTLNFTTTGKCERIFKPAFILNHVKRVEMNFISSLLLNKDALSMIKYLLSSAHVLELLIVKVTDSSDDISEEEQRLEVEACKEVFEWARCSSSSYQVDFLGRYLKIILSGEGCKLIKGSNGHIICM